MTIGIGIVTYNRLDLVKEAVATVLRYTTGPYFLVVADDGSTDGTREFLIEQRVTVVGDRNRGIAWNKNRALYTLRSYADANPIIILEDDTVPTERGWQEEWRKVVSKYGYATHAHPKVMDAVVAGKGTPDDPFGCTKITSQCSAVSREALDRVGYFDTRFRGYGVEDGEWTTRLRNAGYGIVGVKKVDGPTLKANCMISGGVRTLPAVSFRDNDSVRRNRELFERIRNDPIPRQAWRDDVERAALIADIENSLRAVPLVARSAESRADKPLAAAEKSDDADPDPAGEAVDHDRDEEKRPMKRPIYLHIGAGKTGTSAIQVALVRNREFLFDKGVVYPESRYDSAARQGMITSGNGHLLADLLWPSEPVQAAQARGKEFLRQILERYPGKALLFSSEKFESCAIERFVELVDLARANGREIKIIYYVRHLMDFALSVYNQSVKRGGSASEFAKWIRQHKSDYANAIANFSRVVGKENMIVRLYDDERSNLPANFMKILVGDASGAAEPTIPTTGDETVNRSLTPDETSVMLFANGLLAKVDKGLARQMSKKISDKLIYRPRQGGSRPVVTSEELEILKANNEAVLSYVNDFVQDRFKLQLMSDKVLFGERPPQQWTERDDAFRAVLEAVIEQLDNRAIGVQRQAAADEQFELAESQSVPDEQRPAPAGLRAVQDEAPPASEAERRQAKMLYRNGLSAEREGRLEEAVTLFEQAKRLDMHHPHAKTRYERLQRQLMRR